MRLLRSEATAPCFRTLRKSSRTAPCWVLVAISCSSCPASISSTHYAPVIFKQSVCMPHHLSPLLGGFNGVVFFVSSLVPIWITDGLGRRKLMLFVAAGQACTIAALAGCVSTGQKVPGIAAISTICLFDFFFAVGLLAIPWLLPLEYAPPAIRTRAAALGSSSNCKSFPLLGAVSQSLTDSRDRPVLCCRDHAPLPSRACNGGRTSTSQSSTLCPYHSSVSSIPRRKTHCLSGSTSSPLVVK